MTLLSVERLCAVCLKVIYNHGPLCKGCLSTYGPNRCQWPDFVRLLVKLYEKEHNYERRHPHISLDEMIEKEQR